ncbi:MAG: hypothetical protein R3F13_06130 [Prosthecobacter sp.]
MKRTRAANQQAHANRHHIHGHGLKGRDELANEAITQVKADHTPEQLAALREAFKAEAEG